MSLREMVVVSGKGGTGKTTLTACFALLTEEKKVLADTDVDAPNMALLLHPKETERRPFYGMAVASVDKDACIGCGDCAAFCRFSAIAMKEGKAVVDEGFCEGCKGCLHVCPVKAISTKFIVRGTLKRGDTPWGPLWHARLGPGGESSGALVAQIRQEARKEALERGAPLVLIDGPPGVGCPTVSSVTGTDYGVIVTEPSRSALSDLSRIIELFRILDAPFGIVINRWDLSPELTEIIRRRCEEENWTLLGVLPFEEKAAQAVAEGRIPVEEMGPELPILWQNIRKRL